jgi:hypothetical protein
MEKLTNVFESLSPQSYLGAAIGSVLLSLALRAANKKEAAYFVGLCAPTILSLWLYMKLVKPSKNSMSSFSAIHSRNPYTPTSS